MRKDPGTKIRLQVDPVILVSLLLIVTAGVLTILAGSRLLARSAEQPPLTATVRSALGGGRLEDLATPAETLPLVPAPAETQPAAAPEVTLETTPTADGSQWPNGSRYQVREGETIATIAQDTGISSELLRSRNMMFGDALIPGQVLEIPGEGWILPPWRYASLDKDLSDENYPLVLDTARFRLHYMADTYPAIDPQAVAGMMERGLEHVESIYGQRLDGTFDIYVAGTLYEPPNRYLRGRSFSKERKVFFLHDGTGDALNQQYLAAHELTHLYSWNRFGQPFSFLLSEGAAVYVGMKSIDGSPYLPIKAFCAAYKKEGALPILFSKTELEDFRGHANNLVNYYSSGCFVGYLIETYGVAQFGQIYHLNDYPAVYGKTLKDLEIEWKNSISLEEIPAGLDTGRLIASVERFMEANRVFYDAFAPTTRNFQAYYELDKARLALYTANFDAFDQHMQAYEAALNQ